MVAFGMLLILSQPSILALATLTKLGIGVYNDTAGSPLLKDQIPLAASLVCAPSSITPAGSYVSSESSLSGYILPGGERGEDSGWVTLYFNAIQVGTKMAQQGWISALRQAYASGLRVLLRLGSPDVIRDAADDAPLGTHTNYSSLAAALVNVVDSLPAPPAGADLHVMVGNELNACNEWRCSGPPGHVIPVEQMAQEVAAFMAATFSALTAWRAQGGGGRAYLKLAHAPLANWDTAPCQCVTNAGVGPGQVGLRFMQLLLDQRTDLYESVDWLCSHSYPFSGAPYGTDKAARGLTYYRNETALVGRATLRVAVTETGWNLHGGDYTRAQQAQFTVSASQHVWVPDAQVFAVTPFLLAGEFWEAKGWDWARQSNATGEWTLQPVFDAVRNITCKQDFK